MNIREPRILAGLLRTSQETVAGAYAFANGVASALIVALDVTPRDPIVTAFADYVPDEASGAVAKWNAIVAPAARVALTGAGPVIRDYHAIGAVFRYRDLSAVARRLENGETSGSKPGAGYTRRPGGAPAPDPLPGLYPSSTRQNRI